MRAGWSPSRPSAAPSKTVAVVGAGPAGLAVAAELNSCGHTVTVYERDEGPGGLMRFGVPDAKLEKSIIDRRVDILAQEGIEFVYNTDVGRDITAAELIERHDAVVVTIGSRVSRDLDVPGRQLQGIHFAMDYLYQRNRWVAAQEGRPYKPTEPGAEITATGKRVIVIGGGDTGMDCISNSHREGARSVVMLDVYAELPADGDDPRHPWPLPPKRTAYDLRARGGRQAALGDRGHRLRRQGRSGQPRLRPAGHRYLLAGSDPGSGHRVRARGRPRADRDRLRAPRARGAGGAARPRARPARQHPHPADLPHIGQGRVRRGDARIGQSLVVTAIAEGRKCARIVNKDLGGSPMDADREMLAVGAWSGEADRTLRHEAEAAGTVRPGEEFFSGPGDARVLSERPRATGADLSHFRHRRGRGCYGRAGLREYRAEG